MFFVFVCGLKSGETCHFEQNLNHLEATFSHGGFWSVSIGVLYEMTFSLLSSCFLHAKLISPSLHIWKSHEIPMASPSSHEITILHQISHHYLAGKTPWVSRVISFFFSTHRQAIGPPTFGRSWTRCHGVRWYNPEEKHWACNGTGRQDIISVFGVVHAARMFELTSLLCFFIWTWMVLVQPNPVSSFLIYVDVFPHLPDECC